MTIIFLFQELCSWCQSRTQLFVLLRDNLSKIQRNVVSTAIFNVKCSIHSALALLFESGGAFGQIVARFL